MSVRRLLLLRRRIDPVLLAAAMALLVAMQGGGKILFGFFAVCGLYLAVARPRTWRRAPGSYALALIAWALWQIGLSLTRGEPVSGNRVLSYAAVELGFAFVPLGLALVRRPVDALAAGARIGLLVLLAAAPVAYATGEGRVGLGVNEAIFAFVAGIAGLAARLPARVPLRWLPNGRTWTYLAAVPIALSGTRAALVLIVMALVVDLTGFAGRLRLRGLARGRIALGAVALACLVAVPLALFAADRIGRGYEEMQRFEETGRAAGSVDTRVVMWRAGLSVLERHPLLGVGGTKRMAAAAEAAGNNGFMVIYYQHLHNVLLDEALSSGLVGVALMLGVFAAFLRTVWRSGAERTTRETAGLLVAYLFVFGSFHGILLNEWALVVVFGATGCLVASSERRHRRRSRT